MGFNGFVAWFLVDLKEQQQKAFYSPLDPCVSGSFLIACSDDKSGAEMVKKNNKKSGFPDQYKRDTYRP